MQYAYIYIYTHIYLLILSKYCYLSIYANVESSPGIVPLPRWTAGAFEVLSYWVPAGSASLRERSKKDKNIRAEARADYGRCTLKTN